MSKLFEIQTLSERTTLNDPVTIITAGTALLTQLFPNLFGGTRVRLTDQDWLTIIPGSGYWTTQLRNYLKQSIHYNTNLDNISEFTKYFVDENSQAICGRPNLYRGNYQGVNFPSIEGGCLQKFYEILNTESRTGGQSPVGNVPGGFGATIDWTTIALIGGGIFLLVSLSNKKKRKRRK